MKIVFFLVLTLCLSGMNASAEENIGNIVSAVIVETEDGLVLEDEQTGVFYMVPELLEEKILSLRSLSARIKGRVFPFNCTGAYVGCGNGLPELEVLEVNISLDSLK
jgi:hypothetical protein